MSVPAQRLSDEALGDWVDEYARTAAVDWLSPDSTQVLIRNVRHFTYRTREDYEPAYFDARYDVEQLATLDLVVSRWAGEAVAHVFVSFGFNDGRYLSVSIETRRLKGQKYSTWAGFLRRYALIYVVADERDLLGVRTDVRRECVCLYRVQVTRAQVQSIFRDYMWRINELNAHPERYHTLFNNCTTNILRHARAVAPKLRYTWKILFSGYADDYTYRLGLLDQSIPFADLKRRSLIVRAADARIDADYSRAIRAG